MQTFVIPALRFAALALAIPITNAGAQFSEARVGERVRVEAAGVLAQRYSGTILRRSADTLLIGSPDAPPVSVALARITRLDVSRGRSAAAGAVRGAMIGAGVGGVAGLVFSAAVLKDEGAGSLAVLVLPLAVVVEAAFGGAVGGAIGAVVKREVWDSYTPTETRLGLGMRDRVLRIGLRHSF